MAYIGNAPATGENNSFKILDDITSYTLTFNGSYASVVSLADDTITKNEHRFITGQRVTYTHGGGTAIGGLTSGSVYYIVKNDQNTIKLAPSYADAIGSTNLINLSALGTGSSHTLNVAFDGVNTKFKATYDNGTKAGITRAAQLQISINGVIQRPYDSVTPPSGFGFDLDSVIVFSTAPVSTDVFWGNLVANNFPTFDIADNEIDNFIGDATTVSYTLSKTPANSQNILVTLDGVVQYPSDNDTTRAYTLSENVLTFDSAPGAGVFIQVRHIGFAGATSSSVTGFYGRTGNVALRHIDNVKVGDIDSVGVSTFTTTGVGTVTIGIGTTALLVEGNARVTGILTVGNSSITIDGDTNKISIGDETTFIQNGAIGIGTTNFEGHSLNVTGTTNITGNTTIGGDATVGGNISLKSLDYAGISSTISDTATDIFVYDTSKDSDGGAWRYKTQRTSWYNESLNTSTRGSRREFPAVAVIVAETGKVTIYDGDDPDLPMWMVFETGSTNAPNGNMISAANAGCDNTAVSALNGILCVTIGVVQQGGLHTIKFISEENRFYREGPSSFTASLYKGNIAERNDAKGHSGDDDTLAIVNQIVNDVAMTVLPNAPIDSATGLPVPTIAVATDGGVSVIKDDGSVYDVIDTNSARKCYDVSFTKDHKIMHTGDLGAGSTHAGNVFVTNVLTADRPEYDNHSDLYRWYSTSSMYPRINGGNTFNTRVLDPLDVGGHHYAMADVGISLIEDGTSSSYGNTDGMVAYATTSYNTGWMHGDIKGAFLSDTDATNVTGGALIAGEDSNFNGGTIGNWVVGQNSGTALLTNSSNRLKLDTNSSSYPKATLNVGTQQPGLYTLAGEFYMSSAAVQIIYDTGGAVPTDTLSDTINTWHYFQRTFEMTTSFDSIGLRMNVVGGSHSAQFDNLTLSKADPDRSVNNKGLQVLGTITKSAVATGAELVSYSGFSASNGLVQPYNSSMNYGTNDLYIMLWAKHIPDGTTTAYYLFDRSDSDGTNRLGAYYFPYYNRIDIYAPSQTLNANGLVPSLAEWSHIAFVRQNSTGYLYVNGNLIKSQTGMTEDLTGDGTAVLRIGARFNGAEPWTIGNLALFRTGASAPSAEQIKKIYEDEKVLFQENAACTLYGSSDAVTALAYDEVNDLLHVGTSSGRSDFNGLRRINNTTTAVTTAISAYDGLIAAQ
jgi:hypothetical protein